MIWRLNCYSLRVVRYECLYVYLLIRNGLRALVI